MVAWMAFDKSGNQAPKTKKKNIRVYSKEYVNIK